MMINEFLAETLNALEQLKEILAVLALIQGALWLWRKKRKEQDAKSKEQDQEAFVRANEMLNVANNEISNIRNKRMQIETVNFYLRRFIIECLIDCEDCAVPKLKTLPRELEKQFNELLNQKENE